MQITYYLKKGDILELTVRREVEEDDYITHFVDYPDEIESETREGNFTYHYHPVGTRFRNMAILLQSSSNVSVIPSPIL